MNYLATTTNGQSLCVDSNGRRLVEVQKPYRNYLGLDIEAYYAKPVWFDAALTKKERLLFLKHQLDSLEYAVFDYEVLREVDERVLVQLYALYQQPKQHFDAIETNLHGLGRALSRLYDDSNAFMCICIYRHYVLLSVYADGSVHAVKQQKLKSIDDVLTAIRRAELYLQSLYLPHMTHAYYLNFSQIRQDYILPSLCWLQPLRLVPEAWLSWIVPYGVACRGVCA